MNCDNERKRARVLYRVKDLSPEQKHAAEILLGQPMSDDESIIIKRLSPSTIIPSQLSPEERSAALLALNERFAAVPGPEVSAEEEEAAVTEAVRSVRPNYRPLTRGLRLIPRSCCVHIPEASRQDENC
jgi:hypothetical protein